MLADVEYATQTDGSRWNHVYVMKIQSVAATKLGGEQDVL